VCLSLSNISNICEQGWSLPLAYKYWLGMEMTNALAYNAAVFITAEKSFIDEVPDELNKKL
jgi:hypothetical protein